MIAMNFAFTTLLVFSAICTSKVQSSISTGRYSELTYTTEVFTNLREESSVTNSPAILNTSLQPKKPSSESTTTSSESNIFSSAAQTISSATANTSSTSATNSSESVTNSFSSTTISLAKAKKLSKLASTSVIAATNSTTSATSSPALIISTGSASISSTQANILNLDSNSTLTDDKNYTGFVLAISSGNETVNVNLYTNRISNDTDIRLSPVFYVENKQTENENESDEDGNEENEESVGVPETSPDPENTPVKIRLPIYVITNQKNQDQQAKISETDQGLIEFCSKCSEKRKKKSRVRNLKSEEDCETKCKKVVQLK